MPEITEEEIVKFERHCAKPVTYKIGGEEFAFSPLGAEDIPDLLRVIQIFTSKIKPGEEEKWLEALDIETAGKIVGLIKKMVKNSYSKITDQVLDRFVSANFITLTTALFQINDLGAGRIDKTIFERIEKMKKARTQK